MILSIAFLLYSFREQTSSSKPKPIYHRIWDDKGNPIMSDKY